MTRLDAAAAQRSIAFTPCTCSTIQDGYKKSLEGMLMTHVLPLFQSPHGHLRAKAAWVSPAVLHTVPAVNSRLWPSTVGHICFLLIAAGGRHLCGHQVRAWRLWRRAELCSAVSLRCGSTQRHRAAGELMRHLCTDVQIYCRA